MSGTAPLVSRIEPQVSANALEVLRARYLKRDERGRLAETPADMFGRGAAHVADVERRYGGDPTATADAFYEAMARLEFLPNSPALMNAGTRLGQLAACFVLPVDDSLDGIFNSLRDAARLSERPRILGGRNALPGLWVLEHVVRGQHDSDPS